MRRLPLILSITILVGAFAWMVYALDPPHDSTNSVTCSGATGCHKLHNAEGGVITKAAGNASLCQSCHVSGGMATNKPLPEADQSFPFPGLPSGMNPSGTSHRWDSGASGHVAAVGTPLSTGKVASGGAFDPNALYAKTYTITITTQGDVGTAIFSWSDTLGGGATGLVTGANVILDQGITVTFTNGSGSPNSFIVGDQWRIYVRTDIKQPTNTTLASKIFDGKVSCSTCHNQHSQALTPFDPNAPAYGGSGTGAGRHYQRIDNYASVPNPDGNAMCLDCHSARNKGSLSGQTGNLTHPVGLAYSVWSGLFNARASITVPLDKGVDGVAGNTDDRIQCLSCHQPHFAPANDGALARMSNITSLCSGCHNLADTANGAHFNSSTGALWPGSTFGSTFPAIDPVWGRRGFCTNCHQPHGWPDNTTPNLTTDYPKLLVETSEYIGKTPATDKDQSLCYTCHKTGGQAKAVQDEFTLTYHHPVKASEQAPGRSVQCYNCHNIHKAQKDSHTFSTTADLNRNLVSNPIKGVLGWAVNYTGLGNFVAPAVGNYSDVAEATYEYEICFKCHSGKSWNFGTPPSGLSPNGTVTNPVETDLAQEFSPNNKSGHPIVTGLDNYPNSIAVGSPAKKGLQSTYLKAPWNTNVGSQTMMCSDCHNTDAASPAAQGPHGSASQFMLRTFSGGSAPSTWPATTAANFANSWCANCHNQTDVHTAAGAMSNAYCYNCHIVIPHGGKMSRLIGDSRLMPARYAYNNTLSNMWVTSTATLNAFVKRAPTSYQTSSCAVTSACSTMSGKSANETW